MRCDRGVERIPVSPKRREALFELLDRCLLPAWIREEACVSYDRGVERIPVSRSALVEFPDLILQMRSCCLLHRDDLQYPGSFFQGRHVINAKTMLEWGPGLSLPLLEDRAHKVNRVVHTGSLYWLSRCAIEN